MKSYELVIAERQPTCGGKSPVRSRITTVATDDPVAYVKTLEPDSALEVSTVDDTIVVQADHDLALDVMDMIRVHVGYNQGLLNRNNDSDGSVIKTSGVNFGVAYLF